MHRMSSYGRSARAGRGTALGSVGGKGQQQGRQDRHRTQKASGPQGRPFFRACAAVKADKLHRVYYGPITQQEPKLIGRLLHVFDYQARQLGFDVGPVRGKMRYMFFLVTKGRLERFKEELASFDAGLLFR